MAALHIVVTGPQCTSSQIFNSLSVLFLRFNWRKTESSLENLFSTKRRNLLAGSYLVVYFKQHQTVTTRTQSAFGNLK